jgi:hypothetical protein
MDGVEKLVRLFSSALFGGLAVQAKVRQPLEMHGRSRNQIQNLLMLPEHPKNNVSQILQEMEAICNL